MQRYIQNPILPGFYPDPSICRVGDDYYMVTSSFSYFPGVPIFHSKDLIHWEQIGHVLSRPEQLPLTCRQISGGIFAPTIRYHEGVFYMITTNVNFGGDIVCTATDPAGPWSEVHVIEGAPGIDPSLFFDDDDSCWMCGTDWSKGYGAIWLAPFDTKTFALCGERVELWRGAMHDVHAPEAPHIYKKDGWYYLMIAEGGTEFFHSETIARSEKITGKYRGYRGNPILTHRHLGQLYPISNTGHADLVQTQNGEWYMVLLASRPYGGYHLTLGRETFITPVDWSGDWPVVNPGVGHVDWTCPAPALEECVFPEKDDNDFHAMCWNYLGTPKADGDPVKASARALDIRCVAAPFIPDSDSEGDEIVRSALGFYGRRQQHMVMDASVTAALPDDASASCGLSVLQNDFASLRLEMKHTPDGVKVQAIRAWRDGKNGPYRQLILGESAAQSQAVLELHAREQDWTLVCDGKEIAHADGSFMGSESCGGFVGAYIGMFASGNGEELQDYAHFTDFTYRGIR
ncbi:MAG: family 43 glycosylhydrolase [Clostridia bacterium]|nr:family 43 glycosylhydrolase [Clostridia bacterium]